ncbi:hypothetical protein HK101_002168 [Irineochytrium annulatum]|nr:hypothetical protein HK101_002168 [Irineochytrium annulatum]
MWVSDMETLLSHCRVATKDLDKLLQCACAFGALAMCGFLFDRGANPASDENLAIRLASENGHADVVKWLITLPDVDVAVDAGAPLRTASENGHVDVVLTLLGTGMVNPDVGGGAALAEAACNNHIDIVSILLNFMAGSKSGTDNGEPIAGGGEALALAVGQGHFRCAELLMSRGHIDPLVSHRADGDRDGTAMKVAIEHGNAEMVRCMWPFVLDEGGKWGRRGGGFVRYERWFDGWIKVAMERRHDLVVWELLELIGYETMRVDAAVEMATRLGHRPLAAKILDSAGVYRRARDVWMGLGLVEPPDDGVSTVLDPTVHYGW